jgi:hypothetical protein
MLGREWLFCELARSDNPTKCKYSPADEYSAGGFDISMQARPHSFIQTTVGDCSTMHRGNFRASSTARKGELLRRDYVMWLFL